MNSDESWHRRAACRGLDPELFFPTAGHRAAQAKAVCATCPVTAECAEAGKDEYYGVWGGMTLRERQVNGVKRGKVPVRGCWRCGMPRDPKARYCSDFCRLEARRDSQRRYNLQHGGF